MRTIYWIILAIPIGALALYACWKVICYFHVRRLRREARLQAASGYINKCLWGFNDRGELIHVRTRQKGCQREATTAAIPRFLRAPHLRKG